MNFIKQFAAAEREKVMVTVAEKRTGLSETGLPEERKNFAKQFVTLHREYKRLAIFASFSEDGRIHDDVIYYLTELKKVTDGIIFVADNPVFPSELEKLKHLVVYARCARHQEYDFGSYKRGYNWAEGHGLLENCHELVFCNDSVYGPVYPLSEMFGDMAEKECDFWGPLAQSGYGFHLDSFFLVFKRKVFHSSIFKMFIKHVRKEKRQFDIILNYEVRLTKLLRSKGFSCASYITYYPHSTLFPYGC